MDPRLSRPEFWAAHFYQLLGTDERDAEEFLEPFFGVSYAEMHEFYATELEHPDGTDDLLALEVHDRASVAVEYADCGEDGTELRFHITTGAWTEWELVGYDSPHFALPAFRWEEVVALGAQQPLAFPLLVPAVAWPGTGEAMAALVRCWREHPYVQPDDPSELARQIASRLYPATELKWWHDSRLGWINDGRYSFRNPETSMCAFSAERFQRIGEFFRA